MIKFTALILFTFVMQVSASTFAQRVTLSEKNTALVTVFNKISKQTGYDFIVTSDMLKISKPVNISTSNAAIPEVLNKIFEDQPLEYSIKEKIVVISKREKTMVDRMKEFIQAYTLKGWVLNERNEPLGGASIIMINEKFGTVSGGDGAFQLANMQGDERLITRYIGYKPDTLDLRNQQRVTIKLVPLDNRLSEINVYNTGFQKLDKQRATGSFGKPDMDVFAKRTGTMDIIARLEGQVTGLSIDISSSNSSSNPNGNGVTTRKSLVRGKSSVLLATDPLYVVNGVIVSEFSSINPDDIEDMTVLKDAAAAAIWGARASNGVIIITTKTGNKNQRPTVNYSGFFTYTGRPNLTYGNAMNSQQFIQTAKEIFNPTVFPYATVRTGAIAPHEQILYDQSNGTISAAAANQKLDSLASISNLSQIEDFFMRPSITNNHTVSVSAGNNLYSAYGSFGYTGVQNTTPGTKDNSYKVNLTQSLTAGSRLKVTLGVSLINSIRSTNNIPSVNASFLPYQLFKDAAGNNLSMNYLTGYSEVNRLDYQTRSRINLGYTPLDEVDMAYGKSNLLSVNVTANAALKIWKGLSFLGTYGYQKEPGSLDSYTDNQTLLQRKKIISLTVAPTAASVPVYNMPVAGGNYSRDNNDQRNWTVRNQLVYDQALRQGKDHLTLQAGQDIQESYNFRNNLQVVGYDTKLGTYPTLDFAKLRTGISGTVTGFGSLSTSPFYTTETYTRFISYFGLASYSFNNKYSIDASIRQDYSNSFGKLLATQDKPVWSLGGKWRLSQESFLKSATWINELSLRATHGITGNAPLGSGYTTSLDDIFRLVTPSAFNSLIAGEGLTLNSPANKSLSWEVTHTTNIGLDYGLFNQRISGAINVYQRNTTDLLGTIPLNPFSGFSTILGNIGKVVNKGLEININSQNIRTREFSWSTMLNFSYNYNKLVAYSAPSSLSTSASYRVTNGSNNVGYNLNAIFAYRYAGLDNLGDPQIYKADGTITKSINAAQVADLKYMGSSQPPFFGGLTNTFGHRAFSLKLNMVYYLGAVMRADNSDFYSGRLITGTTFSGPNISTDFLNRWKNPGDEAFTNYPSYVASGSVSSSRRNTGYYKYGDVNIVSSSFVKLRDITLSYELPQKATRFLQIQRAGLFLQATNFMVWKANDKGIDPEVARFAGSTLPGHSYSMGVNVSF